MALHIVDEPSFGGRLGTAVGGGISGLLNNLVQRKAQEMQQSRNAQGYEKGWNLNPEQAKFVASQSPEFQQEFVKALQANQQSETFQRAISGEPQLAHNMGTMLEPKEQPSLGDAMGAMGGNEQGPQDAVLMNLQKILPQLQRSSFAQGAPAEMQAQEAPMGMQPQPQISPQTLPQQPQPQGRSVSDILANRPLNPQLAGKAEEIKERRRSTDIKERTGSYDRVKDDIKKIKDRGEIARRHIHDLELVKKLNKSGQLKQGFKRDLAEKFGLENWYTNEPTEVASKLLERQKQGASSAYGSSRMTNFLLDTYSKQLGRLVNTKEGLDVILDNRINEEKGYALVADEMARLQRNIEKNKEIYPYDIENMAYEKVRPKLDELAQQDIKRIDQVIAKDTAQIIKTLPPAAASKGQSKINASRGIRATSDGKEWIITPLESEV